jgi:hypothetical protein
MPVSQQKRSELQYGELQSRVGRLEGAMEQLAVEVVGVNNAVKNLAEGFSAFETKIFTHIGTATAPKWPAIIGIGSMVLTICGLILMGLLSVFGSQRDQTNINTAAICEIRTKINDSEKAQSYYHGRIDRILQELDSEKSSRGSQDLIRNLLNGPVKNGNSVILP